MPSPDGRAGGCRHRSRRSTPGVFLRGSIFARCLGARCGFAARQKFSNGRLDRVGGNGAAGLAAGEMQGRRADLVDQAGDASRVPCDPLDGLGREEVGIPVVDGLQAVLDIGFHLSAIEGFQSAVGGRGLLQEGKF